MLALSQREGDRIYLILPDGKRIEVQTVSIRNGKVRLGFVAASDVTILRAELADKIAKGVTA